jgi:hypothetical protein
MAGDGHHDTAEISSRKAMTPIGPMKLNAMHYYGWKKTGVGDRNQERMSVPIPGSRSVKLRVFCKCTLKISN